MRLDEDGSLHVEYPDGSTRRLDCDPSVDWNLPVVHARSVDGSAVLFGPVQGDLIVRVSANSDTVHRFTVGERIPHAEQLELHAAGDGFWVRFENGLFVLGEDGRERWRIDRVAFDWCFVAERDDALWFSDASGNLLGFSLDTGDERT